MSLNAASADSLEEKVRFAFWEAELYGPAHREAEARATREWSDNFDRCFQAHRLDLCTRLMRVAKACREALCEACQARILLAEGELAQFRGDPARARQCYGQAWRLLGGRARREAPPPPALHAQLARCLYQFGRLAFEQGRPKSAERLYRSALRLAAQPAADDNFDLYLIGLAEVLQLQGRLDEALERLHSAQACEAPPAEGPQPGLRAELRRYRGALVLHCLGLTHIQAGHFAEALAALQACLGRLTPDDSPLMRATVLHHLGVVEQLVGQSQAAADHTQAAMTQAEALCEQSRRAGGPVSRADAESLRLLAAIRHQAGLLAMQHGDYALAELRWNDALGTWRQPEVHDKTGEAQTRHQLGMLYHAQQKFDAARAAYTQALALARECGDAAGEGWSLYQLGLLEQQVSHAALACDHYQSSLQIAQRMGDKGSEARNWHQLGVMAQTQNRWQAAREYYEKALALRRAAQDRLGEAQTLHLLGTVCLALDEPGAAQQWLSEALEQTRALDQPQAVARTLLQLGLAHQALGQPQAALPLYAEALTLVTDLGDGEGQQRLSWQTANAWEQTGDLARAMECLQQLLQALPADAPLQHPASAYLAHLRQRVDEEPAN